MSEPTAGPIHLPPIFKSLLQCDGATRHEDITRAHLKPVKTFALQVITGCSGPSPEQASAAAPPAPPPMPASNVSPELEVVKKAKGPVMTTLEEFYKVGPGPSSSHTIGPMRITYDFHKRCTKLPPDQLAKVTGLKVHLFGSLSAAGKGHGTERASLAGVIGKEPATVEPEFLDSLVAKPDQVFPVTLGAKTFNVSLKDIITPDDRGQIRRILGNWPQKNIRVIVVTDGQRILGL